MYIIYWIQFFILYIPSAQHTFCFFMFLRIMLQIRHFGRKYKGNFASPHISGSITDKLTWKIIILHYKHIVFTSY